LILLKEFSEPSNVNYLTEADKAGVKHMYIEGCFAEAVTKNRNGRIYPKTILTSAVDTYVENYVSKKRAISELSHPENRPMPSPALASHLITELKMVGDKAMGKARILKTPQGQIIEGLINGSVALGVSTRGLGSVQESNGTTYVKDDLVLYAIDCVLDPSGLSCFVDAINESQEWVVTDDGRVLEKTKRIIDTTPHMNESQKLKLFGDFMLEIVSQ
jgi:hypothetical protein